MYIISSRKGFNNPDLASDAGHLFREIDLSTESEIRSFDSQGEFIGELAGKTILMLVHGHNNEQDDVYDAYSTIEMKVNEHLDAHYDLVIGYSWPGGDNGLDWWASKRRADAVAGRLCLFIERVSEKAAALDIMSHSLGARVTLSALKQSLEPQVVRNYFCTAPAVDNEVLEKGEEFFDAIAKTAAIYIFHSKKDGVLSGAYRLAEFDNALGLYGPEDKHYIQSKTRNIFVANCKKRVDRHSGYKGCDAIYNYIARSFVKKPVKFRTL